MIVQHVFSDGVLIKIAGAPKLTHEVLALIEGQKHASSRKSQVTLSSFGYVLVEPASFAEDGPTLGTVVFHFALQHSLQLKKGVIVRVYVFLVPLESYVKWHEWILLAD